MGSNKEQYEKKSDMGWGGSKEERKSIVLLINSLEVERQEKVIFFLEIGKIFFQKLTLNCTK